VIFHQEEDNFFFITVVAIKNGFVLLVLYPGPIKLFQDFKKTVVDGSFVATSQPEGRVT
jgi:hypothetical protein